MVNVIGNMLLDLKIIPVVGCDDDDKSDVSLEVSMMTMLKITFWITLMIIWRMTWMMTMVKNKDNNNRDDSNIELE